MVVVAVSGWDLPMLSEHFFAKLLAHMFVECSCKEYMGVTAYVQSLHVQILHTFRHTMVDVSNFLRGVGAPIAWHLI